jgi:hypothetical protein
MQKWLAILKDVSLQIALCFAWWAFLVVQQFAKFTIPAAVLGFILILGLLWIYIVVVEIIQVRYDLRPTASSNR